MKATIEVKDRKEADNIRAGLADEATRAFVKVPLAIEDWLTVIIMGALSKLPTTRSKVRVLTFVRDFFDEKDEHQQDEQ